MKLEGRVAVITGAGSGIGKASAQLFAAEGAAVVCQDLHAHTAQATADEIHAAGGTACAWACDVRDGDAMGAMFEVADELGPLRILMTSAGVAAVPGDGGDGTGRVSITDVVPKGFMTMLDIHVGGTLNAVKPAIERMIDNGDGGSIIALSSIAGLMGFGATPYATAKGAILGFVRALAREVGPHNIRVNSIAPGVIATPMTEAVADDDIEMLKLITPMGRTGTADEIARTALYLASDDSSFTTGQWLSPNGGLHTA